MNAHIVNACKAVLTPIVRILLKNGMTFKAFMSIAKKTYVDVATADYGINGRPTNTNRVAILTGLDRKTIKQLKELEDDTTPLNQNMISDRITRVLTGWHTDTDFIDQDGKPKALSFADPAPNLETLLHRHGGDIQPTALLKELKRVEVVEETTTNYWRATKRNYMQLTADPEVLMRAFIAMKDLGNGVHHNLYIADEKKPKYFERRVTNPQIPPEAVPEFRDFMNSEGQKFLESIDKWLSDHEVSVDKKEETDALRLGIGMYWIEHDESDLMRKASTQTQEKAKDII